MMRSLYLILTLIVVAVSPSTVATSYQGAQVWRITPPTLDIIGKIKKIGTLFELDFWKEPSAIGRPVDFLVPSKKAGDIRDFLSREGITDYKVYIEDVQALLDDHKSAYEKPSERSTTRDVSSFDYSVYHTVDEIYEWIDMVDSEYPFATKRQYGVTYEGRPMYVLEFKKPSSEPKPIIFVDALIHCREWISMASLLFIFKEMLQNPTYSHMMDEADWYFVPMINIDGYDETWNGDRLWRKTVSTGPSSLCRGVDGNRNWDSHWSEDGASPLPCSYTYHGPTPASESEVRNLADLILGFGLGNISAYVTTHSYTQLILYPYGWSTQLTPDDQILNNTGRMMSEAIEAVHGMYYTWGPAAAGIYVTSGATDDWTYDEAGVKMSYTFELRDLGQYGFLLPADQIIPNGQEFLAGLEVLKNFVVDDFNP